MLYFMYICRMYSLVIFLAFLIFSHYLPANLSSPNLNPYQGTGANSKIKRRIVCFHLRLDHFLHLCTPLHGEYVFCVLQKMQTSCRPARWLAVMLLLVFTPGQCQQKDRWGRPYKLWLTSNHVNNNFFFFFKCNWRCRYMHEHRC